ncbi:putative ribonuclease H-like domain-containing protein [Tanacetum coccineum]
MCDKKNSILFTDTKCVILSPDFKLIDESHVLLKVPRKDNMYSVNLKNVIPQGGRKPTLSFMRPFGCPVTILNTIDHLEEEMKDVEDPGNEGGIPSTDEPRINQEKDASLNITNNINTVSPTVNAASIEDNAVDENIVYRCADDPNIPELEDIVYSDDDEDVGAEADMNNLDAFMPVSPIPTTRIHKDHPVEQIIGDLNLAPNKKNNKELKHSIGTKWVFRNKKDERGIVIKNKARLVAQGYTQEEGIDYDKVFAPVARIKAIRLFLAYASFKDFVVYQMDVKSAFLYGNIKEEVYVCQPPRFEDPDFPDRVTKFRKKGSLWVCIKLPGFGMRPVTLFVRKSFK